MADEHHGTKELASAIRAGASRRPDQAFGDYFVGTPSVMRARRRVQGDVSPGHRHQRPAPHEGLHEFFDCLEGIIRACPVEGCKKRLLLSAMIVHLNDHHEWSRERIADWLEENGAAKPVAAGNQPR